MKDLIDNIFYRAQCKLGKFLIEYPEDPGYINAFNWLNDLAKLNLESSPNKIKDELILVLEEFIANDKS